MYFSSPGWCFFCSQPWAGAVGTGMLAHSRPAVELGEERTHWEFSSSHTYFCSHPQWTPDITAVIIYYLYCMNRCCGAELRAGQAGVRAEDMNKIVRWTGLVWGEWARLIVSVLLLGLQWSHNASAWCIKVSPADDPGVSFPTCAELEQGGCQKFRFPA